MSNTIALAIYIKWGIYDDDAMLALPSLYVHAAWCQRSRDRTTINGCIISAITLVSRTTVRLFVISPVWVLFAVRNIVSSDSHKVIKQSAISASHIKLTVTWQQWHWWVGSGHGCRLKPWVGSAPNLSGSGWIGSRKCDQRTTLAHVAWYWLVGCVSCLRWWRALSR